MAEANTATRGCGFLAVRFPLATTAVAALPACSCLIDGEAIARDQNGLAVFEMIPWRRHDQDVVLRAFDLLELNGQDLRKAPIEERKRTLAKLLRAGTVAARSSQDLACCLRATSSARSK